MSLFALALAVVILAGKATSKYCDGDYFCTPPKECCTLGCCYLYSPPTPNLFNLVIWNHWYLWCVIVVGVAVCCCACGCGLWRKRAGGGEARGGGARRGGRGFRGMGGGVANSCSAVDAQSEPDSAGSSCYQPPHYSRCSSFHQPPPYSEVTSKPDLYPLVISYGGGGIEHNHNGSGVVDGSNKSFGGGGGGGGSYLMVHYFRNYIMRPVGASLSAASTADSLSSSLFCSAANEANSLVPPPYSSAPGSVDQINLHTTPLHQVLSQSESQGVVGIGVGVGANTGSELSNEMSNVLSNVSSVAGPLESPPQATTPTLHHQQQLTKMPANQLGSSSAAGRLKLSLSRGCSRLWLSRSAPSTPSCRLAPFPSSAPFPSQESSPLLLATATDADDEANDPNQDIDDTQDNDSTF